ncbi:MAG: hypothetical protein OIF47_10660, partial [Marinibacterium sp.]|nr:hypothetical protein [Marinibacterium sp.]
LAMAAGTSMEDDSHASPVPMPAPSMEIQVAPSIAPSIAPSTIPDAARPEALRQSQPKARISQSYSNRCRIPDGVICYVAAKTVGSDCSCKGVAGVIVP